LERDQILWIWLAARGLAHRTTRSARGMPAREALSLGGRAMAFERDRDPHPALGGSNLELGTTHVGRESQGARGSVARSARRIRPSARRLRGNDRLRVSSRGRGHLSRDTGLAGIARGLRGPGPMVRRAQRRAYRARWTAGAVWQSDRGLVASAGNAGTDVN